MIEKFLIEQSHPCVWRVPVSGTISQYDFFHFIDRIGGKYFLKKRLEHIQIKNPQ
jgi:hypothetical protein